MIVTELKSPRGVRVVCEDKIVSESEQLFSELIILNCVVRFSMLTQVLQEPMVIVLYEE
jgi:hypothetical protein